MHAATQKSFLVSLLSAMWSSGNVEEDDEDHSVTRPEKLVLELFEKAGLHIEMCLTQTKFPKDIYPVKMFALRPKKRLQWIKIHCAKAKIQGHFLFESSFGKLESIEVVQLRLNCDRKIRYWALQLCCVAWICKKFTFLPDINDFLINTIQCKKHPSFF